MQVHAGPCLTLACRTRGICTCSAFPLPKTSAACRPHRASRRQQVPSPWEQTGNSLIETPFTTRAPALPRFSWITLFSQKTSGLAKRAQKAPTQTQLGMQAGLRACSAHLSISSPGQSGMLHLAGSPKPQGLPHRWLRPQGTQQGRRGGWVLWWVCHLPL